MEKVAVRDPTRASAADLVRAYERITFTLTQVAPANAPAEFRKLAAERRTAAETQPTVESRPRARPKSDRVSGHYDVFISYSIEDRPWAIKVPWTGYCSPVMPRSVSC